jgi:uncharacterized protein YegJ (DUF2314 family)
LGKFFGKNKDASPIVEHMWINEVDFDGDTIHGKLINDPNELPARLRQILQWRRFAPDFC